MMTRWRALDVTTAVALLSPALGATQVAHLESNMAWTNGTRAALNARLRDAANEYRKYAPVPRVALYDVAYPKDCGELATMKGFAILAVTAVAQDSTELPPSEVYAVVTGAQTPLFQVAGGQSHVASSDTLVSATFGTFRYDALYLLPVSASRAQAEVLVDFAAHRRGFRLATLSGQIPQRLRSCVPSSTKTETPNSAAIGEFVQREYPDRGLLSHTAGLPRDTTVVGAVRATAEREPVEAFGQVAGFVRVRDIALLDIDGDGSPEAFVWIEPKVRQTPTILAYSYDQQRGARRLLEGLVPGRLQPVSGQFVDDHTMGFGVDMVVGENGKPVDFDRLIAAGVEHGMSLVRYRTFIHADGRKGFVSFVDLSDRALPTPDTKTCRDFEFSSVDALAAGALSGSTTRYLIVLTTKDITIYRFRAIRPNGTFDKDSWIRARPADAVNLTVSSSGDVVLTMRDGRTVPLTAP